MNAISQNIVDVLNGAFAQGVSVRKAMVMAGVSKHTAMRYQQLFMGKEPSRTATKRTSGICHYIPQATRIHMWEQLEGKVPDGMRLGSKCHVNYCDNIDHFILVENRNANHKSWKDYADKVGALQIDEYLDFPDYPRDEKSRMALRCGLQSCNATALIKFAIRSLPTGGVRIIRVGTWPTLGRDGERTDKVYPVLFNPRAITPEERERRIQLAQQLRTQRREERKRRYFDKHIRDGAQRIWLGQFRITKRDESFVRASRRANCSIKGCVFPVKENGKCHRHEHFFEYAQSMEWRGIGKSDIYGNEETLHPLFSTMQGWELNRAPEIGLVVSGLENRGYKLSEQWWKENVIKAEESATLNIQHTGAFVLWKGFGKKKIRKSQRMRPQGWHGNHPSQKPMERFGRETLDELPQWTPAKTTVVRREMDEIEDDYDYVREEIAEELSLENFEFEETA